MYHFLETRDAMTQAAQHKMLLLGDVRYSMERALHRVQGMDTDKQEAPPLSTDAKAMKSASTNSVFTEPPPMLNLPRARRASSSSSHAGNVGLQPAQKTTSSTRRAAYERRGSSDVPRRAASTSAKRFRRMETNSHRDVPTPKQTRTLESNAHIFVDDCLAMAVDLPNGYTTQETHKFMQPIVDADRSG